MALISAASVVDQALALVRARTPRDTYATICKRNVPFYPEDDHREWTSAGALWHDAAAFARALEAGEMILKRSAPHILVAVDAPGAWPVVRDLLRAKPAPGLRPTVAAAPNLVVALPNVPDEELLGFFEDPRFNAPALAQAVVHHRKQAAERIRILELATAKPMSEELWRLGTALEGALPKKNAAVIDVLRRAAEEDRGWRDWANQALSRRGDVGVLERDASGLDAKNPEPAVNACIALGPSQRGALEARFFSKAALATKKGRSMAASVVHRIESAIMLRQPSGRAWKADKATRALASGLADVDGDALAFAAASLLSVISGKKPLVRPEGKRGVNERPRRARR